MNICAKDKTVTFLGFYEVGKFVKLFGINEEELLRLINLSFNQSEIGKNLIGFPLGRPFDFGAFTYETDKETQKPKITVIYETEEVEKEKQFLLSIKIYFDEFDE